MTLGPWDTIWTSTISQLVALLVGGGLFTIGWGVIAGRREVLLLQLDRVTSMIDEATVSIAALTYFLRDCAEHRDRLPQDETELAKEKARILAVRFQLGDQSFRAISRAGSLLTASHVFDRPAITEKARAYHDSLRATQAKCLAIDPMIADHDSRITEARSALLAATELGESLRVLMLDEITFRGLTRYFCDRINLRLVRLSWPR